MTRQTRRRHKTEQGAVAVIVAVSMLALLVVTGLVLDFGLARTHKLTNKGYTDSAAAAGIRATDIGEDDPRPYRGVCTALAYLRVNNPALADLTPSWSGQCAVNSPLLDAACLTGSPATWASYSGTAVGGRITVQIKSGYTTPDPAFDAPGSADNGLACGQLAVIIQEREKPGLGSLITASDAVTTKVRSVARMTTASTTNGPVALVTLERTGCPAITLNSNSGQIDVLGNGDSPGSIHSDSNGSVGCSTSNPVIYGSHPNRIIARHAETGSPKLPGAITTVAGTGETPAVLANATDGATNVCAELAAGTCTAATGRKLVGRGRVDRRYLTGVQAALTNAQTEYLKVPVGTNLSGYTVVGCDATGTISAGPKVFVNCPSGYNKTATFSTATTVVFNGTVAGNISIPLAQYVYIKGVVGGATALTADLSMNMGSSTSCTARAAVAPTLARAQLVIGNGSFTVANNTNVHLCYTSVLMAESWNATRVANVNCPLPAMSAAGTPGDAPYNNTCKSNIAIGGAGVIDWSAPNTVRVQAVQTDWNALEDLALWTEAASNNAMGGGGTVTVSGVFFLPNANAFTISGNSSQTNGANAQFVSRRLLLNGAAILRMKPSPTDSIKIPLPPSFGLVR